MKNDPPLPLKTCSETVGSRTYVLTCLENFEGATATVYRHLRGGSKRERADICPMFGVIWPSARALAVTLWEQGAEHLRGKRVLELGCGLALPSLVAASLGARVVATDQHPRTESFLERNRRQICGELAFSLLDWREPAPKGVPEEGFDHVIASDVLFSWELPALVAAMFARHLAPGGVGWLADPGRSYLEEFETAAREAGLEIDVDVVEVEHTGKKDEIFLIRLQK